jgi:hypothetical protein
MFSRSDGPTALRADLVRALAFSVQQCELETPQGANEPAVAALAGVWNGRKGFVALVLYRIPSQNVERYVFADAIDSDDALSHAVEEGLAFAESFGFGMDAPEFLGLDLEQQEKRLRLWDKLRKPRPGIAPQPEPRTPDPAPTPGPVAEPRAQAEPVAADQGRAVLGRIELVRRGSDESHLDPLTRLLSYL